MEQNIRYREFVEDNVDAKVDKMGKFWGDNLFELYTQEGLPVEISLDAMHQKGMDKEVIRHAYLNYTTKFLQHKINSGIGEAQLNKERVRCMHEYFQLKDRGEII